MPLTSIQRLVLDKLRQFRTEHSYIGGGAALNQWWPRLSDDMDIMGDNHASLPSSTLPERQALEAAGFTLEVIVESDAGVEVIAKQYGQQTMIQWMYDDEYSKRFFPAVYDDAFGFRLHLADAAVNKVLCATRRHTAARDAIDLVSIVRRYAPLGPLIWALTSKDDTLTPEIAISKLRRIAFGYADEQIKTVRMESEEVVSRDEVRTVLDVALRQAANYCEKIAPVELLGALFVDANDLPVEATETTIRNGTHKSLPIRDFKHFMRLK